MYFLQTSGVSDAQNFSMPSINSCRFIDLCVVLRNCFKDPQQFSIGFKSGDTGGVSTMKLEKSTNILTGMLSIAILLEPICPLG